MVNAEKTKPALQIKTFFEHRLQRFLQHLFLSIICGYILYYLVTVVEQFSLQ